MHRQIKDWSTWRLQKLLWLTANSFSRLNITRLDCHNNIPFSKLICAIERYSKKWGKSNFFNIKTPTTGSLQIWLRDDSCWTTVSFDKDPVFQKLSGYCILWNKTGWSGNLQQILTSFVLQLSWIRYFHPRESCRLCLEQFKISFRCHRFIAIMFDLVC